MNRDLSKSGDALVLLGVASLWQSLSGYVDVYSHRFIFRKVDPSLNPAHISLYAASVLGLFAVLVWWRASKREGRRTAGLTLALAGAFGEVGSGVLNEVYHRLYSGTSTLELMHLSIHGLFVLSMFVVALGGIIGVVSITHAGLQIRRGGPLASAIFFSSIWLLVIGSLSYLAGEFLTGLQAVIFLTFGSFAVSLLSLVAFLTFRNAGLTVAAAAVFFSVNAVVLYSLGGLQFFLPLPLLAATGTELVWRFSRGLGGIRRVILTGLGAGLLAGLALYPFTRDMISFSADGYPSLIVMGMAGAGGGLLAWTLAGKIGKARRLSRL